MDATVLAIQVALESAEQYKDIFLRSPRQIDPEGTQELFCDWMLHLHLDSFTPKEFGAIEVLNFCGKWGFNNALTLPFRKMETFWQS